MSGRELAFVKDVQVIAPNYHPGRRNSGPGKILGSGVDLRITESGLTLSPSGEGPSPGDATSVSFEQVKLIRIEKDGENPDWSLMTVSMGDHWWNRSGIGPIVLRDWQLTQVLDALNAVPGLKDKLSV